MSGTVQRASFRLEHSFTAKPDLSVDQGPGKGILMGQNAPGQSIEGIYLGKRAETPFEDVWLDVRGAHVVYVMGKRRSGKSYTLGVIAEGLATDTWLHQGSLEQGVLILDTMNVYMTMASGVYETFAEGTADVRELQKWKIGPEDAPVTVFHPRGTSTPSTIPSVEMSLRASDLGFEEWCALFEADPFTDPLGHLISEVYAKVRTDGYVDSQTGKRVPANPTFTIDDLLHPLDHDSDIQRYPKETRESLRRRLDTVRRLALFSGGGLDVRQFLQPRRVTVLLLRDLDFHLRAVMVAIIVKKIMQLRAASEQQERAAAVHKARAVKYAEEDPDRASQESQLAQECERAAQEGLPRSWLIIDEAHNYIPASGSASSRKALKTYVSEGRNLGLSIVVATQHPAGLDPSIQRNADMLLVHALSHRDDIYTAEGMINTACPSEVTLDSRLRVEGSKTFEAVVRGLPLGYALASTDRANRLFPLRVRPRLTVHGGSDY